MSYINEALKKAQELKDSGYAKYCDIPSAGNSGIRRFRNRVFLYSALIVVLLVLLFSGYKWMHISHERGKAVKKAGDEVHTENTREASPDKKKLYDKAMSLYKAGRITESKKLYEAAVALDPGYVEALNNLGIIYIRERDFNAAEDSLKKAVRLDPSYVEAYYNLACLYAVKGDNNGGLAYLEKAASLNSEVREWAKSDSDLQGLKTSEEFNKITDFHPIK